MRAFAEDLEDARASIVWEEDAAVIRVVAELHGLETDPTEEIGIKGPWHRADRAIDTVIRVLVQAFGWTQAAAAQRMGYSANRAMNARRPPELDEDEVEIAVVAADMIGRAP